MSTTVENSIRDLLPDVVIEFLEGIVDKDDTIREILLVPSKLSYDCIQEIILENKNGRTSRRVFGFTPINARLIVSRANGKAVMQLVA